jgi:mono/diheme cytochrome c family protein
MRAKYIVIFLLFLALSPAGTRLTPLLVVHSQDAKQKPVEAPTYENDIRPLFQAKCWRCHGEKAHKADLQLTSLAAMQKGGESGPAVVAGNPEVSLLYEKVHSGAMPPGKKDLLSEAEVHMIRRWIEGGLRSGGGEAVTARAVPRALLTQHDVVPIMLRHCAPCHGLHRQEAGLDLRTRSAMLRGGKSGPAIAPGKPEDSLVLKKIRSGQMPPHNRLVEASVKQIEQSETDVVAGWIASGALEASVQPDVATTMPDTEVTPKDREFWAFRPPQPFAVPAVRHRAQVRNPIDAFVLQKLEAAGLALSPEADRPTLLRRASLDLTGLPPEPAEVQAYLGDPAPDAYEKMIERLLASPRYGERWARFWLDLAGYADSEGKREQDLPRPHAWRYRDYVIRAFNSDKPYDRFLLEQIAGDELADYEHATAITPELYDNLVATGFLRMAPDPTWANITGFIPDRLEVIADEIDVLGSAVMGLTLKCARCHSHKFDPIPQRDYYRMIDVFKGAFDEYDWLKPDIRPGLGPVSQDVVGGRHLPFVTTSERRAWEAHNAQIERDAEALRSALDRKAEVLSSRYREERLAKLPEVLRADLRAMLTTTPDKRTAIQRYLAEKFEKELRIDRNGLTALDAAFKKEADETDAQIRALHAQRLAEPRIQALWDRGEPSPTYIYRRGDSLNPGRLVGPGVPSVLTDGKTPLEVKPPWQGAKKTGRRSAFARWLIQLEQPLTARVQVNRIWKHHFGAGIVSTLGNFGKAGTPPTHPEFLDWLAKEFVRQGWSIKAMHRLMMTSATYRQRSAVTEELAKLDPANVLYSRMPMTRLDAESLYDTLLFVAGRLDETPFGPATAVQARPDGLVTPAGNERGWRRLIYVQQTRKQIPTHLENFDFPPMNPNCVERRDSTVAPQALHLLNNGMVGQLAEHFARRVSREAGTNPVAAIEKVYWIALSRPPGAEELKAGLEAMRLLTEAWASHCANSGRPDREEARMKSLTTYCHAIMNSAGFLYVD